jgi:putative ABC transport system permease protein
MAFPRSPERPAIVPQVALRMLLHNRARFTMTVAGIAFAFFLATAQVGLLVGWINTNSALIEHTGADLWVMAEQTPAYDYGTAIPRHRIQQVRSVPGIAWAEGLFVAWNVWQHKNGKRIGVELIGLDKNGRGGPWAMAEGRVEAAQKPDMAIVDELYAEMLGVDRVGEAFEMFGRRVRVGGLSKGVRTFTASPFVFTSIASAIRYDKRYRDDEITYVIARCAADADPEIVRRRVAAEVGHVEVLTAAEFAARTVKYWMLETGVGITVVITAVLGLAIGAVIISQTLFAVTQDHLANYATLLALGFHHRRLHAIVLVQSMVLGALGIVLGGGLFGLAAWASARTPIPLEMTPAVGLALVILSLLCCAGASWASVRAIFRLDPVTVFQG